MKFKKFCEHAIEGASRRYKDEVFRTNASKPNVIIYGTQNVGQERELNSDYFTFL